MPRSSLHHRGHDHTHAPLPVAFKSSRANSTWPQAKGSLSLTVHGELCATVQGSARACRPGQTPIGLDSGPSSPPRPTESEERLCWCLASRHGWHHIDMSGWNNLAVNCGACARRRDLCGSCAAQPLPPAAGYCDRATCESPSASKTR